MESTENINVDEVYVTLEMAKLAKEKGFDLHVNGCYIDYANDIAKLRVSNEYGCNTHFDETYKGCTFNVYSRPSQELLKKWLLEKHNVFVYATPSKNGFTKMKLKWDYTIYRSAETPDDFINSMIDLQEIYDTYDEAKAAGLLFVLNSLTHVPEPNV
jgi:hypothetical protein